MQHETQEPRPGNVWMQKSTGQKIVIQKMDMRMFLIVNDPSDWELVSERPHGDGDLSYVCGSDYCRCMQ